MFDKLKTLFGTPKAEEPKAQVVEEKSDLLDFSTASNECIGTYYLIVTGYKTKDEVLWHGKYVTIETEADAIKAAKAVVEKYKTAKKIKLPDEELYHDCGGYQWEYADGRQERVIFGKLNKSPEETARRIMDERRANGLE